ncbi:WD40 repeat-like protein [Serendipita vermifera]|nr:WD40 repeat-like protein [Serendipita vermifera]
MSSQIETDSKGSLYLYDVGVDMSINSGYRVKLRVDGSDIPMTENKQSSIWTLSNALEVTESSTALITLKTGHRIAGISFGREEISVEVDLQQAFDLFFDTLHPEVSISKGIVFIEQPATVSLTLRSPPSLESVRSALQVLENELKEYRHLMTDSTERRLNIVIECGVALSEMDPYAKVAFGLASAIFNLLKEQKKHDQMVSDLTTRVKHILPFAEKAIEEAMEESTDLLRKAVEKLYVLTLDLAQFTCEYVKQNRFKRVAKSIISLESQQRISEFTEEFGKLVEDFGRAVDIETLKIARSIEEKLLIKRLEPVKTGHNLDSCCMEGTREVILNNIVEWALRPIDTDAEAQDHGSGRVYWLYGMPGIGKTSVAHSICARLHDRGRLGGSFFCRRDDQHLSNPRYVLPTLMCRLAEMWRPYKRLIAERLREDPQLNRDSAGYTLLTQILGSLQIHPPYPLVLLIDALDECGDSQGRSSILATLFSAASRVNWLKIIITSRPEQDIESYFSQLDDPNCYLSKDLKTDDNALEDIRFFVEEKCSTIAARRYLEEDWPGEARKDSIVTRSGGLFIFVDTLCSLLKDDLDPEERLNQTLSSTSGDALISLYDLYSSAIESRVGENKKLFQEAMRTIIAVGRYRPLCEESVAELANLNASVVKTLVDELSSLLYRDAAVNGGIRVRHLSIMDFLTGVQCPSELRIDIERANRSVGMACINAMIPGLKFNICQLESSLLANDEINDLQSRIDRNISDVLQYSSIYWSNHICHIFDHQDPSIYGLLDAFVADLRLLYWIEALSVMGKVSTGDISLRRVLSWAKDPQMLFVRHMSDALRFLITFRTAISTSAPHIYASALPFTPTESQIWQEAGKVFHNLPNVERGRMKTWAVRLDRWTGHTDWVTGVVYSPNGRNVASCSRDGTIRIWDVETGAPLGEPMTGDASTIWSIAYSPDGRTIVSGSQDQIVRIWDVETGTQIGEPLEGHDGAVNCVAYSPDGRYILSGSDDAHVLLWDAKAGTPIGEPFEGHTGTVRSVVFSPDTLHVISGSDDATVRIWDAKTGLPVCDPLEGHTQRVRSVACSPDGRYIVSGSDDMTIRIWEMDNDFTCRSTLEGHSSLVMSLAYSPDGTTIASGSWDDSIQIWNIETGEPIGEPICGHTDTVWTVAYSPDGKNIISGSMDNTVRIWDAETGAAGGESLKGHDNEVNCVAYSPDGHFIVSGSDDDTIRIWDAVTGEPIGQPLVGHDAGVWSVSYSPDGRYIASGSEDDTIRIWDAKTGDQLGEPLTGHTNEVNCVVYSPDGLYIASGSDDCTVRIWEATTGTAIGTPFRGHTARVWIIAYSPNGRSIISSSSDETIRIWDTETGAVIGNPLRGHDSVVNCLAYSPDGLHIISGSEDNTLRVWNAETGAQIGEPLRGHTDHVLSIACSPDGQYVVSGSKDQTMRLWDLKTDKTVCKVLKGHAGEVWGVEYSPDGQSIVSGSGDNTIRVWKTQDIDGGVEDTAPSVPDSNGWVRHSDGGLLLWVPDDCRHGLICPAILNIPTTGRHKVVRLNLDEFSFGKEWANIKKTDYE